MEIKIELKCSNKVQILDTYKVSTGDAVRIHFNTAYDMTDGEIRLKNGTLKKFFAFSKDFLIPDEFLFDGRLYVRVEMKMAGRTVKHWDFAPIRIMETEGGYEFQDEISELQAEVEDLKRRMVVQEDKHKVFK